MGLIFNRKKEEGVKPTVPNMQNPLSLIFGGGGQGGQSHVTDSEKLIRAWLDKNLIHMKTNLSQNQINSITILMSLANQFHIQPLKDLLINHLTYMISKDSASAKQLVNILQNRGMLDEKDMEVLGRFAR